MSDPKVPLRATERRHPRSVDLDLLAPLALVDLYVEEDRTVPAAVGRARVAIAVTLEMIGHAFEEGGRLIYVGAGTSGRLGVLDASECPPTFGTPPEMVQGIIAGGPAALVRSIEGAEDDEAAAVAAIDLKEVSSLDLVLGIAASGGTPFVRAAIQHAKRLGARTALLTCAVPEETFAAECDAVIQVDVGPELITGSTRLKAGTATKLVLNILTTGAMVRLGKTWGNLMVDLQATNVKLRDRGERMVMDVTGVDREAARSALQAADNHVRTAIVMVHLKCDRAEAEHQLAEAQFHLRRIVGAPPEVTSE